MNPEEIRNMLRREPFVPFRLHLRNQSTYDITQPEMVLVTLRTTHIGIHRPAISEESHLYDAVDVVSNLHIAKLEPIVPVTPSD